MMPLTYQVTTIVLRAFNMSENILCKYRKSMTDNKKLNEGRQKFNFVTAWLSTFLPRKSKILIHSYSKSKVFFRRQ